MVLFGTIASTNYVESETIYYYPSSAEKIKTPLSSLSENPSPERVRDAIVWLVNNNGGNQFLMDKMLAIAFCESSFNVKAYVHDDGGSPSTGLYQYKDSTFSYFAQKYHIKNPDINNPAQQIELTYYLLRDGYGHLWTCFYK